MRLDLTQEDAIAQVDASLRGQAFTAPTEAHFIHLGMSAAGFEAGIALNGHEHSSSTGARPEFSLYVDEARIDTSLTTAYGRYNLEGPNWLLASTARFSVFEMQPGSRFLNVYASYEGGWKYARDQGLEIEERLQWTFPGGGRLITGLSYGSLEALPKTGDLPFPYDTSLPPESQGLYYLGTDILDRDGNDLRLDQRLYNVRYTNLGAYLQYQRQLRSYLDLTLGMRFDDNSRYGSSLIPRMSLVVTPRERMKVKLLYGEGFQAPAPYTAFEQFGSFDPAGADGRPVVAGEEIFGLVSQFWHAPNPLLEPEELEAVEIAFTYYLNDNLEIAADLFDIRVTNRVANRTSDEAGLEWLGVPVMVLETPQNVGTLNSHGGSFYAGALYDFGKTRLRARLSMTFMDGDLDDNPLPYAAEETFGAIFEVSRGPYSGSLRYKRRGRSFLDQEVYGEVSSNEPFDVTHLFLRYDTAISFRDGTLALELRADNLFDVRYDHVAFGGLEAFPASPQDPRRVSLGLTVSF